jgi:hypothetical protein
VGTTPNRPGGAGVQDGQGWTTWLASLWAALQRCFRPS